MRWRSKPGRSGGTRGGAYSAEWRLRRAKRHCRASSYRQESPALARDKAMAECPLLSDPRRNRGAAAPCLQRAGSGTGIHRRRGRLLTNRPPALVGPQHHTNYCSRRVRPNAAQFTSLMGNRSPPDIADILDPSLRLRRAGLSSRREQPSGLRARVHPPRCQTRT
jgi:hypothetical protein